VVPLEAEFFARGFGAVAPALDEVRKEVRAAGLWAPQLPTALGGMGLPLLEFGLASRELGRSPLGHFAFNCQAPDAGNMELLAEFADAAQRERFLMPLARGEIRSCFAMTEPAFPGSNPTWMATTARRGRRTLGDRRPQVVHLRRPTARRSRW
jgi:alkylation response protein AidB-like acyl-CoA dehydrogenase